MRKDPVIAYLLLCLLAIPVLAGAAGPDGVLEKIKSKYEHFEAEFSQIAMKTEVSAEGPNGKMNAEQDVYKKGGKVRIESYMPSPQGGKPSLVSTMIYDGKNGWLVTPQGTRKLSAQEADRLKTEDKWWSGISSRARVAGEEKVDGKEAYIIEIKEQKNSPATKIWVSKDGLVLLKAESDTSQGKAEWVFSDFHPVKDWQIPYRTEMLVDGKPVSVSRIKSFEVNPGLPDSLFEPEKASQKGQ